MVYQGARSAAQPESSSSRADYDRGLAILDFAFQVTGSIVIPDVRREARGAKGDLALSLVGIRFLKAHKM